MKGKMSHSLEVTSLENNFCYIGQGIKTGPSEICGRQRL